jgi:putative tryptophan/tyrosine transport system substrate-binding protein
MRRRDFIKGVAGSAAVWPLGARAQQPAMPVIGFLGSATPELYSERLRNFRRGLQEEGYVEGQNVAIEYRWAENQNERLPVLAAELVRRQLAVLVAGGGTPSALAAKAASATIPIVFAVAVDPIEVGLVASLNRPGGNLTGVTNMNVDIGSKRLELLHEVLPKATNFGVLIDPTSADLSKDFVRVLQSAAHTLGVKLYVQHASTEDEIDTVFASLSEQRAEGLVVGPSIFFNGRTEQLAALGLHHAMPTIYQYRPFAAAGGLVSYGSDEAEYYRLVGMFAGKILKGEKPQDLPVEQSTKVELIINLKTAKALGITMPLPLLGRADEVIE